MLGFLGTVVHFGTALGGHTAGDIGDKLPTVVAEMGTAFNTTTVALVAATSMMFCLFLCERDGARNRPLGRSPRRARAAAPLRNGRHQPGSLPGRRRSLEPDQPAGHGKRRAAPAGSLVEATRVAISTVGRSPREATRTLRDQRCRPRTAAGPDARHHEQAPRGTPRAGSNSRSARLRP